MEATPIEALNFKLIREELGFTQTAFAQMLGLTTTADIERGKTRIPGAVVKELFKLYQINPLWLFGESTRKIVPKAEVSPKVISLNESGTENILMVNAKAAAGYGQNIGDATFYEQLPVFTFPLPAYKNATFRSFQVKGDSMVPLVQDGDWVFAKAVADISAVKAGQVYIVVEADSIRLKQIEFNTDKKQWILVSLNAAYPPVHIETENILELWEYHSKITTVKEIGPSLDRLFNEMQALRKLIEPN